MFELAVDAEDMIFLSTVVMVLLVSLAASIYLALDELVLEELDQFEGFER